MTNKTEWAKQITATGQQLPDNWSKLSAARAEAAKDRLVGKTTRTVGSILGAAFGQVAAAIAAGAGAVGSIAETVIHIRENDGSEDIPMPQLKQATMPKNPNWGRSEKAPGKTQFYPVRRFAADPVPMTRQVRRQIERRSVKQPLFMKQGDWHRAMGYGKLAGGR